MSKGFEAVSKLTEEYWAREHERTKALLKRKSDETKFDPDVVAFWTMGSLIAGTVVLLRFFDLI